MAEYFYYFRLIYLINYIISLYDVLTFKKIEDAIDEMYPTDITPESSMGERMKVLNKAKSDLWKSIPFFLALAISWVWVICGTQVSEEPYIFWGLIILSVATYASALIYSIAFMARNKEKYIQTTMESLKGGIKFIGTGAPDTKIFNVIDRLIRISVVSYILYIHLI